MNDTMRAKYRVRAYLECVLLVEEAVRIKRAHLAAVNMTPDERRAHPETWRLPELDLESWYGRAEAAVKVLEETGEKPAELPSLTPGGILNGDRDDPVEA